MLLADSFTFWDALLSMIVFFAWFMFVAWVIMLLFDNFRRDDHGGLAKAGWAVLLIFLPLIGAVSYVIARPATADVGVYGGYGYDTTVTPATMNGRSTAEEIARLNELRTEGAISDAEYDELKRRAIVAS